MSTDPASTTSTATTTETSAVTTETFAVNGMTCRHCEMAVTAEVSKLPGVCGVVVDVAAGTVTIGSERPLDRRDVGAAVDEAGYELA